VRESEIKMLHILVLVLLDVYLYHINKKSRAAVKCDDFDTHSCIFRVKKSEIRNPARENN
jgi:hypothetical protein